MFIYLDKIEAQKLDNGVVLKVLGSGERMNVVHWNMAGGAVTNDINTRKNNSATSSRAALKSILAARSRRSELEIPTSRLNGT